ncbi:MAG: hypothetical protein OXC91_08215 [Rhodobacteraceae bacterium]|nr:hypothetical protein [Paracoccaceae bacterium]
MRFHRLGPSNALIRASLSPYTWFGRQGVSRIVRVHPSNLRDELSEYIASSDLPRGPSEVEGGPDILSMRSGERLPPGAHRKSLNWMLVPHVDPELELRQHGEFKERIAGILGVEDFEDLAPKISLRC